ncbi:probable LRR receptor-like serine/threonine-protein kinase, partial [Tanacetum coccineum]
MWDGGSIKIQASGFEGPIPTSISLLSNLKQLRISELSGEGSLFPDLSSLTSMEKLMLRSCNITGTIPSYISTMSKLKQLDLSFNNLEGEIPDDLKGLSNVEKLYLTGNSLNGSVPDWIRNGVDRRLKKEELTRVSVWVKLRDVPMAAFIVDGLSAIATKIFKSAENTSKDSMVIVILNLEDDGYKYLSDRLNLIKFFSKGLIYSLSKLLVQFGYLKSTVDLSYNNFIEETVPTTCRETLSYSGGNHGDLGKCLRSFRCSKPYYSVHINCGGPEVTIGNKVFEDDQDPGGAAKFIPTNNPWGYSNTGYAWDANITMADYTTTNVSTLTMNGYELYTKARHSSLSLTYYGRCLANGNYTVTLYFAEIVFRDNRSFQSLGRRVFDVYVQEYQLKNFDIMNEAGGVDKE